jgi:hypothetical protein
MKKYGEELRKSILATKEHLLERIKERNERIANWQTDEDDCFLSQRVEERAISECNMQLTILDGDGTMTIDAVIDQDGNEVNTRWVDTRYGLKIVGRGVFANSEKALLKKTGWTTKEIKVPCWTKFCSSGSGLLGVYSGSYQVVRWHTNMVTGEYVGYPD